MKRWNGQPGGRQLFLSFLVLILMLCAASTVLPGMGSLGSAKAMQVGEGGNPSYIEGERFIGENCTGAENPYEDKPHVIIENNWTPLNNETHAHACIYCPYLWMIHNPRPLQVRLLLCSLVCPPRICTAGR